MANLDVSETRLPQDGRFSFTLGRKELNLRVSCLPTNYGESVVDAHPRWQQSAA